MAWSKPAAMGASAAASAATRMAARVSVYAAVDDLQAYLDKAERLGARVVMPVTEVSSNTGSGVSPSSRTLGLTGTRSFNLVTGQSHLRNPSWRFGSDLVDGHGHTQRRQRGTWSHLSLLLDPTIRKGQSQVFRRALGHRASVLCAGSPS
jgi:hypothetical protein